MAARCRAGEEGLREAPGPLVARAVHCVRFGRHRYLIPLGYRNTQSGEQVGVARTRPVPGGQDCRARGQRWVGNVLHSRSSGPALRIEEEMFFLCGFTSLSLIAAAELSTGFLGNQG